MGATETQITRLALGFLIGITIVSFIILRTLAGFLLSIIDRYKGNILVVCPNSFFTISGYTGVVKRRGDDYGVLL